MAKTLSTTLEINFRGNHQNVALGTISGRNVADKPKVIREIELTTGTGADQADLIAQVTGTIAGSGTADIDLAAALTDAFGAAMTFARLKKIIIENLSDAVASPAAHIDVGPAASNGICPWLSGTTPKEEVRVGGGVARWCKDATGYAGITAGTGDLLRLTNKHASQIATYRVTLVGASA